MGLLDDAIREHLELKRRHGADPDEVSRQEREALGAPVRGEFAKPAAEAGDDAPADPQEAPEPVEPEGQATEVADVPEFDEPRARAGGRRARARYGGGSVAGRRRRRPGARA